LKRIATLIVLLALCFSAEAHDTWIMTTSRWVSEFDLALVQMTEGHGIVPMAAPPGEITVTVKSPRDEAEEFSVGENTNLNGHYYRFGFDVEETGLYVAMGEQHEGALTFVRTNFGAPNEEMEG